MHIFDLDLFEEDSSVDDCEIPGMKEFYLDYAKNILAKQGKKIHIQSSSESILMALQKEAQLGNEEAEILARDMYCNNHIPSYRRTA